jgi:hypothetical protein
MVPADRPFKWRSFHLFDERAFALPDVALIQFLPMTSAATPVSAAAEQQHHNNDNEDQFHGKSPLMVMTSNTEQPAVD